MIHYSYIIGGNIELHIRAEYMAAEPDVDFKQDIEIIDISLTNGDEISLDDIDDISIGGVSLEELLVRAGLEHTED